MVGRNISTASLVIRFGNEGVCTLGSNSVVGTGSVVTKPCGENVVIAGVPARVVRENICWNTENTDYFNRDYLDECIDWEVGHIQEIME